MSPSTTMRVGNYLKIVQVNVEGMSKSKSQYLSKLLTDNNVDVALIQETHLENEDRLRSSGMIEGYDLIGATTHLHHGVATYVRDNLENVSLVKTCVLNDIHVVTTRVAGITIINVYKPPKTSWPVQVLETFPHPALYAGDFNSHHTSWKYQHNDQNGDLLVNWADMHNLHLVFDAKDGNSFKSAAWRTESNPDLCFVTLDPSARPLPVRRSVMSAFPHSQHRPVLLEVGMSIPIIKSFPKPRWNFRRANWQKFTDALDRSIRWIPARTEHYGRFLGAIHSAAKKSIPRGFRKHYIPGWNDNCKELLDQFLVSGDPEIADDLLEGLDNARRTRWMEITEKMNFQRSSRSGWSLLRKLGGNNTLVNRPPTAVTPNDVASRIVSLSRSPRDKQHQTLIMRELSEAKRNCSQQPRLFGDFSLEELTRALSQIKNGKAPGYDGVHPEFLLHLGDMSKRWLCKFFSHILESSNLPKELKKAKIIALLKPGKNASVVESYRPIALLSSIYKLLERLLLNRIGPALNNSIPIEQAGFRAGRSCCDQVLSLTSFIEAGFQRGEKTSAVFIDLTAAYDTVWKNGLLCKLYRVIPCRLTMRLINSMLSNRFFAVVMDKQSSRTRKLNNGLPQGSVLAPAFFNVYISDLPNTLSRKFPYADDLALAARHKLLKNTEITLTSDMQPLEQYFKKWRLTPSLNKTVTSCFHLNNREANQQINIVFGNTVLPFEPKPKYLGVTLDRTLTFKQHLENVSAKIRTRNNIIQKLCGTSWGARASTLRISALALAFSTAEYCAPVWLNSHHVKLVDTQLNETMRLITGCIRSTPLYWLPVLSHIAPPHLRRQQALMREYYKITQLLDLDIHSDLPDLQLNRLKSRHHPMVLASRLSETGYQDVHTAWYDEWNRNTPEPARDLTSPFSLPGGLDLPRKSWTTLNRVRTMHGVCADSLQKWGKVPHATCDCGEERQTLHHITMYCPRRSYGGLFPDFFVPTTEAICWANNIDICV